MARTNRLFLPNTTQHVVQRGNNRTEMFKEPPDYEIFLHALRDAAVRHRVDIHAYVLMTNHLHLMLSADVPGTIGLVMQSVGRRYVHYFNRRYGRTGTLFEGRYRSFIVDNEAYWYTCMRYVERNPVRAGLADSPADYRWSSFRANGLGLPDLLVVPHRLYLNLGDTTDQRQRSWRAMCEVPLTDQELADIRGAIQRGDALGQLTLSSTRGQP